MKREKFDQLKSKFDRIDMYGSFLEAVETSLNDDKEDEAMWSLCIEGYGLPGHSLVGINRGYIARVSLTKEDIRYICGYLREKKLTLEREVEAEW